MRFVDLCRYANNLVEVGTIRSPAPPGITVVEGKFSGRLVGEITIGQFGVLDIGSGGMPSGGVNGVAWYSLPPPERVWVVPCDAILGVTYISYAAPPCDTPHQCPLCKAPALVLWTSVECTKRDCRFYKK